MSGRCDNCGEVGDMVCAHGVCSDVMSDAVKAVIVAAVAWRRHGAGGMRGGLADAVDALLREDPAWGEQCGVCAGPVTAADPPEPVGEGLPPERTCASCCANGACKDHPL